MPPTNHPWVKGSAGPGNQPLLRCFRPGVRVGFLLDLGVEGEVAAAEVAGAGLGSLSLLNDFIDGASKKCTVFDSESAICFRNLRCITSKDTAKPGMMR